jgi:FkbM family methyltransferase
MYEAPERAELVSEIDKAKGLGRTFVFVDIGAKVGLFSLFVASYAGTNAKILAIEPEPENLRRLRFNVAANPDIPIQVIALALGESAGRVVCFCAPERCLVSAGRDVEKRARSSVRFTPESGHVRCN